MPHSFVVLGAGVVGLSTALELRDRFPESDIIIVSKNMPGDRSIEYASPWAGANWLSVATDNGRQENWDRITYQRFSKLAKMASITGVRAMGIYAVYDNPIEDAGILSTGTNRVWYNDLVGGLRMTPKEDIPTGAKFAYECDTFVIDVHIYLSW